MQWLNLACSWVLPRSPLGWDMQWPILTSTGAEALLRAMPEEDMPKGQTGQASEYCKSGSCSIEQALHWPIFTTNQPKGGNPSKQRANSNQGTATMKMVLYGKPVSVRASTTAVKLLFVFPLYVFLKKAMSSTLHYKLQPPSL